MVQGNIESSNTLLMRVIEKLKRNLKPIIIFQIISNKLVKVILHYDVIFSVILRNELTTIRKISNPNLNHSFGYLLASLST